MQLLCDHYKPQAVLQHPHTTDTLNIWAQGWIGVRRFLPEVKTYSSGINYYNWDEKPRKPLDKVLEGTAMARTVRRRGKGRDNRQNLTYRVLRDVLGGMEL